MTGLKLNMDVEWSTYVASIGGVLHKHEGLVKLGFTQVLTHSPSPEHVETIATPERLRKAKRSGLNNFILENDYKNVVDQLKA